MEKASKFEAASNETRVIMKKCIAVCSLLSVLGIVSLVMEVYALLALQFCDGEDLMSLYWSTWTTLQLGSLVAMFGIILAATNQIRGRKNPYVSSVHLLCVGAACANDAAVVVLGRWLWAHPFWSSPASGMFFTTP